MRDVIPEIGDDAPESNATRKALSEWFKTSSFEDIKFWIAPNVIVSQEECEAEILAAVREYEELESTGRLDLVPVESLIL